MKKYMNVKTTLEILIFYLGIGMHNVNFCSGNYYCRLCKKKIINCRLKLNSFMLVNDF